MPLPDTILSSEMKPFYSWCPCHREIGQTNGAVLLIGGVEIRRSVTLWCLCGTATYWRPMRARAEVACVPAYAKQLCTVDR